MRQAQALMQDGVARLTLLGMRRQASSLAPLESLANVCWMIERIWTQGKLVSRIWRRRTIGVRGIVMPLLRWPCLLAKGWSTMKPLRGELAGCLGSRFSVHYKSYRDSDRERLAEVQVVIGQNRS